MNTNFDNWNTFVSKLTRKNKDLRSASPKENIDVKRNNSKYDKDKVNATQKDTKEDNWNNLLQKRAKEIRLGIVHGHEDDLTQEDQNTMQQIHSDYFEDLAKVNELGLLTESSQSQEEEANRANISGYIKTEKVKDFIQTVNMYDIIAFVCVPTNDDIPIKDEVGIPITIDNGSIHTHVSMRDDGIRVYMEDSEEEPTKSLGIHFPETSYIEVIDPVWYRTARYMFNCVIKSLQDISD